MPGLAQRVAGPTSGMSRATPSCQTQALRSGGSLTNSPRNGLGPLKEVISMGGRTSKEHQFLATLPIPPATVVPARSDSLAEVDPAAIVAGAQGLNAAALVPTETGDDTTIDLQASDMNTQRRRAGSVPGYPNDAASAAQRTDDHAADLESNSLTISVGDIHTDLTATTFVPLLGGPVSPARSSAPCSPASSINLSGPCSTVLHSSSHRLTSSSGVVGGPDAGGLSYMPVVGSFKPTTLEQSPACQHQLATATQSYPHQHIHEAAQQALELRLDPLGNQEPGHQQQQEQQQLHPQERTPPASPHMPVLPSLSHFGAANSSNSSSRRSSLRDQNSVTIKATTVVKDAAGAIDKILSRGVTALVTALRSGTPPYNSPYDSLNQAVKAIAVARQYAKETGPEGSEVTFLPFHRFDNTERPDPSRFAFLVFPVPRLMETLKTADETVLNVARGSDVHKMAGAIIAVMLDRGQAVMKAAGSDAIFVAMSAVVNARHRLVQKHGFDLMLAAAWITEDTVSTMGRESKFLRFNILKTEPAGPKGEALPCLSAAVEAC